jgi:molybdate transport system substrate-binding protein
VSIYKNFKFQISNFKFQILLLTAYCLLLTTIVFAEQKQLTIAAASDLSFALKEIAAKFEKDTGIKVILSFGSTGILSHQIENGAPFDIFFAANLGYIDTLKQKGLIVPDTSRVYAQGRIVLAMNKKFGGGIKRLEDLASPSVRRIAIANPDHAPYGIAAKEAMVRLGLWDKLKPKLIYSENIRQAVQFIQTGDASAGVVALSVADTADTTYTIIDSSLHNPINQAVAIIKTTKVEKDARLFIDYVNSPDGRTIMRKYGFRLPGEF